MVYSDASLFCKGLGGRLCTAIELGNDVAKGSGCSLDTKYVWSSSPCQNGGHLIKKGSTIQEPPHTKTCASTKDKYGIRCCADSDNQVPASQNSASPAPPIDVPRPEATSDTSQPLADDTVPNKYLLDCPNLYEIARTHGYNATATDGSVLGVTAEDINECAEKCSANKLCNLIEYEEPDATTDQQDYPCHLFVGLPSLDRLKPSKGATACTRMVSRQGCPDLGFKLEQLEDKSVCEFSCEGPHCAGHGKPVQFTVADDYCSGLGARLCSIEEISDDFRQSAVTVWTYQDCNPGYHMSISNVGQACSSDKEKAKIRCCADKYGRGTLEDYLPKVENTTEKHSQMEDLNSEDVQDLDNATGTNTTTPAPPPRLLTGLELELSKGQEGLVRIYLHQGGTINHEDCLIVDTSTEKVVASQPDPSLAGDSENKDHRTTETADATKGDASSSDQRHAFHRTLAGKNHKHNPHKHSPHRHHPHSHNPTKKPTPHPTRQPTKTPTKKPTSYPVFSGVNGGAVFHHVTTLSQGNHVGRMHIGLSYKLSFSLFFNSYSPTGWTNIFRATSTNHNCCNDGDRSPTVFHKKDGQLQFGVTTMKNKFEDCEPKAKVVLHKWTSIEFEVVSIPTGISMTVRYDGKTVCTRTLNDHISSGMRTLYTSDSHYKPTSALIKLVKIENVRPTREPTSYPTVYPTNYPTQYPTKYPTAYPTKFPTGYPTKHPTEAPTRFPTPIPTGRPTAFPTPQPTKEPTKSPTNYPTPSPTHKPSLSPTHNPTESPTESPTDSPTLNPSTSSPTTLQPTASPTLGPTIPPSPMNAYVTVGKCNLDDDRSVWASDRQSGMILRQTGHDYTCLTISNDFLEPGGPVGMTTCDAGNAAQKWILPEKGEAFGSIVSGMNTSYCLVRSEPTLGGMDASGSFSIGLCERQSTQFEVEAAASYDSLGDMRPLATPVLGSELKARGIKSGVSNRSEIESLLDKELVKEMRARGVEDEDEDAKKDEFEESEKQKEKDLNNPDLMSIEDLQDTLSKRGLPIYGSKSQLADRLSDAMESEANLQTTHSIVGEKTDYGHVEYMHRGKCLALHHEDAIDDLKAVCPKGMAISNLRLERCGNSVEGGVAAMAANTSVSRNNSLYAAAMGAGSSTLNTSAASGGGAFLEISSDARWYQTTAIHHIGKNCWRGCAVDGVSRGGRCMTPFCGKNGHCCRKGYHDPGCGGNNGCDGNHCCVPPLHKTFEPTPFPTLEPTMKSQNGSSYPPTNKPTERPSGCPTIDPTMSPTFQPTESPTIKPVLHLRYSFSCIAPVATFGRCAHQKSKCLKIADTVDLKVVCPQSATLRRIQHHSTGCPEGTMSVEFECCGSLFSSVMGSSRFQANQKVKATGILGDVAGVTIDAKSLRAKKDCSHFSTKCEAVDAPLLDRMMKCPSADYSLGEYHVEKRDCPSGTSALKWTCCKLANAAVSLHTVSTNRVMITMPASSNAVSTLTVPGALAATGPQGFGVKVTTGSQIEVERYVSHAVRSGDFNSEANLGWDTGLKIAVTLGHTWFPYPGTKYPAEPGLKSHSIGFAKQYCTTKGPQCEAITPASDGGYVPAVLDAKPMRGTTGRMHSWKKIPGKTKGRYAVTPGGGAGLVMCLNPDNQLHAQALCCNDKGHPTVYDGCKNVASAYKVPVSYEIAKNTCKAAGLEMCSENMARGKYAKAALKQCDAPYKGTVKVWTNTACIPTAFEELGIRGKVCSQLIRSSIYPLCLLECRHYPSCKGIMWQPGVLGSPCELASACGGNDKSPIEGPTTSGVASKSIPILRLVGSDDDDGEELLDNKWHTLQITETGMFGKVMNDLAEMPARFQFIEDGQQTTPDLVDFISFLSDANDLVFGGNSKRASVMHRLAFPNKIGKLIGAKTPGKLTGVRLPKRFHASQKYDIVIEHDSHGILFSVCDMHINATADGVGCAPRAQLWSIILGNEPGTVAGRSLLKTSAATDADVLPGLTYFVLGRRVSEPALDTAAPTAYTSATTGTASPLGASKPLAVEIPGVTRPLTIAEVLAAAQKEHNTTVAPTISPLPGNSSNMTSNMTSTYSPAVVRMPSLFPTTNVIRSKLDVNTDNATSPKVSDLVDRLKNLENTSDKLEHAEDKLEHTPKINVTNINVTQTVDTDTTPKDDTTPICAGCPATTCANPTIKPARIAPVPCGCPVCVAKNPINLKDLVNQTATAVVNALLNKMRGPKPTAEPTEGPSAAPTCDGGDCSDSSKFANGVEAVDVGPHVVKPIIHDPPKIVREVVAVPVKKVYRPEVSVVEEVVEDLVAKNAVGGPQVVGVPAGMFGAI